MKLLHGCFKHGRIASKITRNVHNCFISASTWLLVLKHWQNGSFITNIFNVSKIRLNYHVHFHYLLTETSCFRSSYRYEWYYRSFSIVDSFNSYKNWLIRYVFDYVCEAVITKIITINLKIIFQNMYSFVLF